jgi:hypothetical protein
MQLNREQLVPLLEKLTNETPAQFGNLKPQEMIEHITVTFQTSSNQKQWPAPQDAEKANAAKQYMIYTDAEMPQGIKTTTMGELPPPLIHTTMADAIACLLNEIETFHTYFKNNPEAQASHPRMGNLTYTEWVVLHTKHLRHHFKQFGLLK